MANKVSQAKARNSNGDELTVQSHETDALVLPIAQLESLHSFRPDLVDVVINQTIAEAEHRRKQDATITKFIFYERFIGQIGAIIVAFLGVGGGIYAMISGSAWLGGTIATITIGTLSVSFLRKNSAKSSENNS